MDYIKAFKKYLEEGLDNIDDKEAKMKFKDLKDKDIDNDGDVDDSDSYLHNKLGNVAKNVKEEELDEISATGNLDGGEGPPKTPYAFGKMDDEDIEKGGYKKVKESTFMKMSRLMNEVSYRDYKKDPTSTPQQKVNRGIMEVNKMLGQMEKIVNNNIRLKTEMGVQSNHFWKSTGNRFSKINERMTRIANKLKELSQ
tara:strand:- start:289 stop:879 length:591 start_codon:yes stop_codon:yes gene_type:complete